DGPGGPEPAAPVQDHDTALVVRAALAALPVEQRAALVLVDVQGYPVIEAAEILGVAEGTIKSRCARGRARMALALGHLRTGSDTPGPGPAANGLAAAAGPAGATGGDGDHAGNRGPAARVPSGSAATAPHLSAGDGSVADRGDQQ
ncbi:sigma factor-like helix-turn-helix DNA-binding protein, partial [Actinoplanes sp. NPDC048791]|uniref:sigma factor-like helix-turn-helix DNA-binding protein n=1 Tax=Actinoplanes sp. NPDC048791 TaxID=3154623 RepID=UPI0033E9AA94